MKVYRLLGSILCVILVIVSAVLFPALVLAEHTGNLLTPEKITASADKILSKKEVQAEVAEFLVSHLTTSETDNPMTSALATLNEKEKTEFMQKLVALPSLQTAVNLSLQSTVKEVTEGYTDGSLDLGPVMVSAMQTKKEAFQKLIHDMMLLYMENPKTRVALAKTVTAQGIFSELDPASFVTVLEDTGVQTYIADIAAYTVMYTLSDGQIEPMNMAKAYQDLFTNHADAMAPVADAFMQGKDKTSVILALNVAGSVKGLRPLPLTADNITVTTRLITVFEDKINAEHEKDLQTLKGSSPVATLQEMQIPLTAEDEKIIAAVSNAVDFTGKSSYTVLLVSAFAGLYLVMSVLVWSFRRSLPFIGYTSLVSGILLLLLGLAKTVMTIGGDSIAVPSILVSLLSALFTMLANPLILSAVISLGIGILCIVLHAITKRCKIKA